MSITLDELIFDPANPDDGANVGATLRGADGTVIGNVADALKVTGDFNITNAEVEISNDVGNPIPVSATDLDIRDLDFAQDSVDVSGSEVKEDAYSTFQNSQQTVSSTAVQLAATALTDRRNITIQNLGTRPIFIGSSNAVTNGDGVRLARGASMEVKAKDTAQLWAITQSGSADVRILESAY